MSITILFTCRPFHVSIVFTTVRETIVWHSLWSHINRLSFLAGEGWLYPCLLSTYMGLQKNATPIRQNSYMDLSAF